MGRRAGGRARRGAMRSMASGYRASSRARSVRDSGFGSKPRAAAATAPRPAPPSDLLRRPRAVPTLKPAAHYLHAIVGHAPFGIAPARGAYGEDSALCRPVMAHTPN